MLQSWLYSPLMGWYTIVYHSVLWDIIVYYNILWGIIVCYSILWGIIVYYGVLPHIMGSYGTYVRSPFSRFFPEQVPSWRFLATEVFSSCLYMGGCQHYGPVLGTLYIRCRFILEIQKGTMI